MHICRLGHADWEQYGPASAKRRGDLLTLRFFGAHHHGGRILAQAEEASLPCVDASACGGREGEAGRVDDLTLQGSSSARANPPTPDPSCPHLVGHREWSCSIRSDWPWREAPRQTGSQSSSFAAEPAIVGGFGGGGVEGEERNWWKLGRGETLKGGARRERAPCTLAAVHRRGAVVPPWAKSTERPTTLCPIPHHVVPRLRIAWACTSPRARCVSLPLLWPAGTAPSPRMGGKRIHAGKSGP